MLKVKKFIQFGKQQIPISIVITHSLWVIACSEKSQTPKTVFIIVDGISADVIEKLNPPVLDEISKAGGYTRAYVGGGKSTYTQTPTISAVGYNSLLTGTWVNKHNVWDNDIADPNYHYEDISGLQKKIIPKCTRPSFPHGPIIVQN